MPDLIWINGSVLPSAEAQIGVEDRGFQFADGVYEVIRIYDGQAFTLREHLDRLERSATAIRISLPIDTAGLERAIRSFVKQAGVVEGMIYLQLTRGVAPRNHPIPDDVQPTLLFYSKALPPVPPAESTPGVSLFTVEDDRWQKCWIKSIALLANILAKTTAIEAGADEAVFVDNGIVTECSTSNLFIVRDDVLLTHPVGKKVLPGITRQVIVELAEQLQIRVEERPFTLSDAQSADEVFITSTTREINWVRKWDDLEVASGPGPIGLRLHQGIQQRVNGFSGSNVSPASINA